MTGLKQQVKALEKQKVAPSPRLPCIDKSGTRVICVLLVIQAVISFRSAPRALQVPRSRTELRAGGWIPHFTSIIHWTLRVGLARLQAVERRAERWVALMDCSIDIGVRKALVILRVFAKSGNPSVILKDQGTDLKRGVQLWRKRNQVR